MVAPELQVTHETDAGPALRYQTDDLRLGGCRPVEGHEVDQAEHDQEDVDPIWTRLGIAPPGGGRPGQAQLVRRRSACGEELTVIHNQPIESGQKLMIRAIGVPWGDRPLMATVI